MKKLLLLLPILGMLITACGGGATSPKDVALKFTAAMHDGDYETAKKYATDDTKKVVDMVKGMANMGDKKEKKAAKYQFISEKVTGETAVVKLKNTVDNKESDVQLKKVSGKWLVAMDKQQMTSKDGNKDTVNKKPITQ